MPKKTYRIASEVRADILRRIKEEAVPVSQAARDHGVSEAAIYRWLGRGVEGTPTLGELVRLKRENQALCELVGALTLKLSAAQKRG